MSAPVRIWQSIGRAIRAQVWRVVAFGLSALLAVFFGFVFFSPAGAGELVRQYGYFGITATLGWFVILGVRQFPAVQGWWRGREKSELRGLFGLVGGLSVVAWLTVPVGYKVLYDELVLQATSWNLHYLREIGTMVRGYEVDGVFLPLFVYLDKRPYFYALLVSFVHDLFGFQETNAFYFNAVLFPVVLILFYVLVRRLAKAPIALAGLACFGANPLLVQNANGAGMDLLNLAMLLAMFLLAARYLEKPEAGRLSLMLLACVLLAQTRYESLLFVVTTGLIVIEGWRRAGRILLPVTAILAPLLLVPSALHNSYLSGTPALWELKADMDSRFEWVHVWPNLRHAMAYFFNFKTNTLGAWWLSVCGLPALGWLGWRALRHWRELPRVEGTVAAVAISAIAIGANLALLMAYFWGQLNDPIVSRLILPFTAIMGIGVVLVLRQLQSRLPQLVGWTTVGALVAFLGWAPPASAHHSRINQLATELEREQIAVSRLPPASRLVLTDKTTLGWLMKGVPALSLSDAGGRAEQIQFHLDHGTFDEVLVTQRLRPNGPEGGFQVDPRDEISARFELQPIWERMQGARLVRISKVVSITPAPPEEVKPPQEAQPTPDLEPSV